MEAQEIFDTVARHLIGQNAKSYQEDGSTCAYRGADGRKCAAGVLLTDAEASACGEGWSWPTPDDFDPERDAANDAANRIGNHSLVRRLQWVHDTYLPAQWLQELAALGEEFGLDTSVLGVAP